MGQNPPQMKPTLVLKSMDLVFKKKILKKNGRTGQSDERFRLGLEPESGFWIRKHYQARPDMVQLHMDIQQTVDWITQIGLAKPARAD